MGRGCGRRVRFWRNLWIAGILVPPSRDNFNSVCALINIINFRDVVEIEIMTDVVICIFEGDAELTHFWMGLRKYWRTDLGERNSFALLGTIYRG